MGSATRTEAGWLRVPDDVNELVPALWSSGVSKVNGVLTVAGLTAPELAAEFGTPAYIVDEDDFRARARAFRDARAFADAVSLIPTASMPLTSFNPVVPAHPDPVPSGVRQVRMKLASAYW